MKWIKKKNISLIEKKVIYIIQKCNVFKNYNVPKNKKGKCLS